MSRFFPHEGQDRSEASSELEIKKLQGNLRGFQPGNLGGILTGAYIRIAA
jgi:hypothetical protein